MLKVDGRILELLSGREGGAFFVLAELEEITYPAFYIEVNPRMVPALGRFFFALSAIKAGKVIVPVLHLRPLNFPAIVFESVFDPAHPTGREILRQLKETKSLMVVACHEGEVKRAMLIEASEGVVKAADQLLEMIKESEWSPEEFLEKANEVLKKFSVEEIQRRALSKVSLTC